MFLGGDDGSRALVAFSICSIPRLSMIVDDENLQDVLRVSHLLPWFVWMDTWNRYYQSELYRLVPQT